MHAYILQFVIFTVVRSDMACHLRWDDINEKRALIEYRDRHKSGHHSDRQYNVVITDGVAEILDAMRTRRQRERLDSEYVFVQGSAPMGINARLNQPTGPSPVNAYLERALEWIGDTGNKNASVHGFRTTFPTWACDLNDYPYELVKATLGHAVGRQQVDAAYFRNVKYLDQRRKMMAHWERHCLSFCDKPQQEKVVPLARRTEGIFPMHKSTASKAELPPILCSIPQASAMIGRGTQAIYDLIGGGKIRAVKSDGRTLIVVQSLHEYAASLPPAKVRPPRNRRPLCSR